MSTFRILFWLRWRLALNTTTTRGRWAAMGITALLALGMSPIYAGGAVGAWTLVSSMGAHGLLLVFGLCQLAVVWVSLLTGAMGRLFELDKLKRYPLRAFDVFAINTLASLGEPIVLMTLPSLVAAVLALTRHDGAAAGMAAAAGAALLLLVTAAFLQLLLALLDDLLRREWMRYVAALFFTLTIVGFQVVVGRSSAQFAQEARKAGVTPETLTAHALAAFERIPTVAAPAALAGARPAGWLAEPWAGFIACCLLIAIPLVFGSRVMARASLRSPVGGTLRPRASGRGRSSFAPNWPLLTPAQSLLVERELLYLWRTPALLYQMAVIPLTVIGLSFLQRPTGSGQFAPLLPLFIMVASLAGRNLMLWGYDGPGVRTLFLMPTRARDLVLSKNLVWLASSLLEATLIFTYMTVRHPAEVLPQLPMLVSGYLAVVLAAGVLGTWVSIMRPMRPPQQGIGRRSPNGMVGLLAVLTILAIGASVGVAVWAARSLTQDGYDGVVSLAVTLGCLFVSGALWWLALNRNADSLERQREAMIDAIAKSADA